MTKKIFIGADTAVVGLLRFSDRNYVDLDELIRFSSYVWRHTAEDLRSGQLRSVVTDINLNSIIRMVQIHSRLFALENEQVFLNCEKTVLPALDDTDPYVMRLLEDFGSGKIVADRKELQMGRFWDESYVTSRCKT